MPFRVYVLRSLRDKKFYKGMTQNLDERLKDHNAGRVPSTRHRRPFELAYFETYATRDQARNREKFFKSGPGVKFLKAILAEKAQL
ncbi:MAG TPA: endonuclease [Bacteroidetes bacterium]|nr:endonuclease [Bacteroidota bacterium]